MNFNISGAPRTRQILEDLEVVRENLLALSDDIWFSIDHNAPAALEAGVEFKRAYNAKAAAFDVVASELSALVQQFTFITLEETERSGDADHAANDRIIAELNREEPHRLNEDFTYKRPHGFILSGQGTTGITTWQRLYELVLKNLWNRNAEHFRGLCGHSDFTTTRGNHTFTTDADQLRKSLHGQRWSVCRKQSVSEWDSGYPPSCSDRICNSNGRSGHFPPSRSGRREEYRCGRLNLLARVRSGRFLSTSLPIPHVLQTFATTLAGYRSGLLAWYDHPISTGPLEGTNNKIKTMKRQAYGYRDQVYFVLKILALHYSKWKLIG